MTFPVAPPPPPDPTSLASGNYTSSIILNRIFKLILNMITSLQNTAAAQAARLTFMSQWQKGYTDALAQIHTFQAGDGTFVGGTDSAALRDRNTLNQQNSSLVSTMQNRQSVVSDDAKALQSNVNQSNDAVNQQSN